MMIRHMVQRSLSFVVLAGLISCKGDPTGDLRNGTDHLVASPSSLFMGVDSSRLVVIGAVDEQGNQLSGNFKVKGVTGPFTVELDSTYAPVFDGGDLKPQKDPTTVRYIVTPHANTGNGIMTVSAGGKDLDVPIRIRPAFSDITLSSGTPALGDTVVATLGPNQVFTSASEVTIDNDVPAVLTGLSADSTQLRFLVGPGASSDTVRITNVNLTYTDLGPFTAKSSGANITTVAAPVITPVFSSGTPNVNQNVTVTAPAGFKFLPNANVNFGTNRQTVVSVAADSNSLVYRPFQAGASGVISIGNVVFSSLTVIPLVLNTTVTATVGATVNPLTGQGAIATAPLVAAPGFGQTSGVSDAGVLVASADCGAIGNHCFFYKLVVPEDRTLKFTFTWGNTADIGGYFMDAAGGDVFGDFACDAKGSGAAGQPESCTEDFEAGTYYIGLADFTAAAQNTSFTVKIEAAD